MTTGDDGENAQEEDRGMTTGDDGDRGDRSLGAIPRDVAARTSVNMFRRGSEHMATTTPK